MYTTSELAKVIAAACKAAKSAAEREEATKALLSTILTEDNHLDVDMFACWYANIALACNDEGGIALLGMLRLAEYEYICGRCDGIEKMRAIYAPEAIYGVEGDECQA